MGRSKSQTLDNKSQRIKLADDTIQNIDSVTQSLAERKGHVKEELSGWIRSSDRLEGIIRSKGESPEALALRDVAVANVESHEQRLEAITAELAKLDNLRTRAERAKGAFEIFENTRYLVEKTGVRGDLLTSPETEIAAIRKDVFALEGHREILS